MTVKITPEAGGTRVEIGMQKWADKAAVAAVAILLSAGLLVALPALGAYMQYKLTEDVWKAVEVHIAKKAGGYIPPFPGRCGNCGSVTTTDSEFCTSCGANLAARLSVQLALTSKRCNARFCNRCGKSLGPIRLFLTRNMWP